MQSIFYFLQLEMSTIVENSHDFNFDLKFRLTTLFSDLLCLLHLIYM